jgi:hypothetical protein
MSGKEPRTQGDEMRSTTNPQTELLEALKAGHTVRDTDGKGVVAIDPKNGSRVRYTRRTVEAIVRSGLVTKHFAGMTGNWNTYTLAQ